jgi:hypothetical protein
MACQLRTGFALEENTESHGYSLLLEPAVTLFHTPLASCPSPSRAVQIRQATLPITERGRGHTRPSYVIRRAYLGTGLASADAAAARAHPCRTFPHYWLSMQLILEYPRHMSKPSGTTRRS